MMTTIQVMVLYQVPSTVQISAQLNKNNHTVFKKNTIIASVYGIIVK